MINADVVVENKLWNKKIKDPNNYIKKKIKKIFKFNSLKKRHFSLTILLTSNSKMKYLNKKFRNKNKTTDVLSFPNLGTADFKKKTNTEIYLGDIALNYEIIPLSIPASGIDSKITSAQQDHYPEQFQNLNNCIKLMG